MKKLIKSLIAIVATLSVIATMSAPSFAYTVKRGDTLGSISKANGISVDQIVKLNSAVKDRNLIFPGQILDLGEAETYHRVILSNAEKKALESIFDADYYKAENPDVVKVMGDSKDVLFSHYLVYGLWETRQPNKNFNVNAYASAYEDLRSAFAGDDLGKMVKDLTLHYANYGIKEERKNTTIDACLADGMNVLYYGAYDNGTPECEKEHVVASVPLPETDTTPSAPSLSHEVRVKLYEYFMDAQAIAKTNYPSGPYILFSSDVDSLYPSGKSVDDVDSDDIISLYERTTDTGADLSIAYDTEIVELNNSFRSMLESTFGYKRITPSAIETDLAGSVYEEDTFVLAWYHDEIPELQALPYNAGSAINHYDPMVLYLGIRVDYDN